ncbi:MAG: SRPBCC family protein [Chloroflexota bacterium]
MNVTRAVEIKASASTLWRILAEEYDQVGEWTTQIEASSPNPDLPQGEGRVCVAPGFGDIKETITYFDEKTREFSYEAEISSFPFFVKEMGNSWRVEPKGNNRAVVHMNLKGRLLPVFAQIMGPIMRRQLAKSADTILSELKYYAETGKIHPDKLVQLSKGQAALA